MKTRILIFTTLLFLISSTFVTAAEPTFTLKLDSKPAVYVDEEVNVKLSVVDYVYGEHKTSALDFQLIYNHEDFKYQDFSVTGNHNLNVTVTESVYSENQSKLRLIVIMMGKESAVNTDTDLLNIKFTPQKMSETSDFILFESTAATSDGILFHPVNVSTTVTVYDVLDVNQDGVINLADAAIASYRIGESAEEFPNCDVNRDGEINMEDVKLIIYHILNLTF
ncbi:dockerin type I repeat-containing protein [Alkaliphilus peptidifermentans]|uniref:Dockerin domain-containing protein n=1 Tax=Alkaliphilus peptidifermentans DSM 18978 TaxID=1120976 RepID=A0A1G5JY41_9FIRM|nr:dockerin type I repeat-containing protein [Alkaliphilus peptidifermentans]SCY93084.1 hypothetical protein SAMN03080606_03103 [Alkaliphilus peptidifermentans DSM 18978]